MMKSKRINYIKFYGLTTDKSGYMAGVIPNLHSYLARSVSYAADVKEINLLFETHGVSKNSYKFMDHAFSLYGYAILFPNKEDYTYAKLALS